MIDSLFTLLIVAFWFDLIIVELLVVELDLSLLGFVVLIRLTLVWVLIRCLFCWVMRFLCTSVWLRGVGVECCFA